MMKLIDKAEKRLFQTIGRSMDDGTKSSICADDKVVGIKVDRALWLSCIWAFRNEYPDFILKFKDSGLVIRRVLGNYRENEGLTLYALNPDKNLYPDFVFDMNEIEDMYLVDKVFRNRHVKKAK